MLNMLKMYLPVLLLALFLAAPRRGPHGARWQTQPASPMAKAAAVFVLLWGAFVLFLGTMWNELVK